MSRHVRTLRTAARQFAASHETKQTLIPPLEGTTGHEASMQRIASRQWQRRLAMQAETALYEHTVAMNRVLQDVAIIPEIFDAIPLEKLKERKVDVEKLERALQKAREVIKEQVKSTEYGRDCLIDMQHRGPTLLSPFPLQDYHEECAKLTDSERRSRLADIQRQIKKGEIEIKAEEEALRVKFTDIMGEKWVERIVHARPTNSTGDWHMDLDTVDDDVVETQSQWLSVSHVDDPGDGSPPVTPELKWAVPQVSEGHTEELSEKGQGPLFQAEKTTRSTKPSTNDTLWHASWSDLDQH